MDTIQIHSELSQWLKDLDFLDLERRFFKKIIKDYLSASGLISQKVVSDYKERLDQLGLDIHPYANGTDH